MTGIDTIMEKNEIDMLLGIPSHQLEYAIENEQFLDITDKINNLEKFHKGIVDISKKRGNGKLYYMSPVFEQRSLLFQNMDLLNQLHIKPLSEYASWYDFLDKLDEVQGKIKEMKLEQKPLAFGVKNIQEDILFSEYDYLTHAFGLDTSSMENNQLSSKWEEFYKIFAKIIMDYGLSLEEMENGIYPKNYVFTNNEYGFMLADSYDVELLYNQSMNETYNKNATIPLEIDFPVKISYLSYDGSKTQNLRDSSIAIDKDTKKSKDCIEILNYVLSKEYTMKMIDTIGKYSHFSSSSVTYPTYFDEDTIKKINKSYHGRFDANIIYDVEYGSIIYSTDLLNNTSVFEDIFNRAFTLAYNKRKSKNSQEQVIEESLQYIQNRIQNEIVRNEDGENIDIDTGEDEEAEYSDMDLSEKSFSIPSLLEEEDISGMSLQLNSKGTVILTYVNQIALDSAKKADITYKVRDSKSGEVYNEVRKIGNHTGLTIDLTLDIQKNKEVKVYAQKHSGTGASVSGMLNW
ncbi:MAG: extracellular solute-binding protein [Firmicutes bacterium]|uniref:Extracellular solute-binding protein n=1 Tax=Candidatus Scybalomonas excrementavium TaxID=2840943 RepID=A0A9D9I126_9FIRM|nr:extracellular solute-binding protein [Candidatus Scybalomonas excrementavium]